MDRFKIKNYYRSRKVVLYVIADIIIILGSLLISVSLWNEGTLPGSHNIGISGNTWEWFRYMLIIAPLICVTVYSVFHMYNNLWKYASIDEVIKIFIATTIIFVLLYFCDAVFISKRQLMVLSRRMLFIAWAINTILVTFSRFGYRLVKRMFITIGHVISSKSGLRRVMVIGAGYAGYGVVRGLLNAKIRDKIPVIVVDPDINKHNTTLMGIRVVGGTDGIPDWVLKYQIDEIIIALPYIEPVEMNGIMSQCAKAGVPLKIIPPMSDISEGRSMDIYLRDVNISDLLYREEVKLDNKNISAYINNRVIMVTGGGGSIGSELCRQIVKFGPSVLVIFDIYENNAFELMDELKGIYKDKISVKLRVGSVQDVKRLKDVFEEFRPHVVFHLAAHKHVSVLEESPAEAVKNNIIGTQNAMECAKAVDVERFVLISSDKAVNPANVYGATKRIAELLMQRYAASVSKTKFITVRFGNVLDSNGSVVHLFKHQIKSGGPVTVMHPDIIRYFMSIPEAAQLVLQAVSAGQPGKIYVLDMGRPVKIDDMARDLIRLSGLKPDKDIQIVYTGLRPGDKMYEELMYEQEKESMQVSFHKKIIVVKPLNMDYDFFDKELNKLKDIALNNPAKTDECLHEFLPAYQSEQ